jgi:hypothetical protein
MTELAKRSGNLPQIRNLDKVTATSKPSQLMVTVELLNVISRGNS